MPRPKRALAKLDDALKRNDDLVDIWSLIHCGTGVLLGWLMNPYIAVSLMILWEPFEILVLSPLLKKRFNVIFGYETLRNSLSDIVFDIIGVGLGTWALTALVDPPFHLFT